jgi:DNA (cytosine-5)-methyltransferase 1
MPTFLEFFAGGGMVSAGLGSEWRCLFANDFCEKKVKSYISNWGDQNIYLGDIRNIESKQIDGKADLAWASFPCQDLSVAGNGTGLKSSRSGTFWPFINILKKLKSESRSPQIIAIENVCGTITNNQGADFKAIVNATTALGYKVGAMTIDARHFVPQSRPRFFLVCVKNTSQIPSELISTAPIKQIHSNALIRAYGQLDINSKEKWVWWNPGRLPELKTNFSDVIEQCPSGVQWHSDEKTDAILGMMSDVNLKKVREAQTKGYPVVGGVYKRTRMGSQRAEVRFDNLSGCLRTPTGGSSRQTVIVVEGSSIRTRLLSPREGARLMGLDDTYKLPEHYNTAYHLVGDGVVAPVVSFLAEGIFKKILAVEQDKKVA